MQSTSLAIKGIYRDILKRHDGTVRFDSGWKSNTIVQRCHVLLAGFMNNAGANGIQFLAVGQGDPAWDTPAGPPPPPVTATDLVNRFAATIPVAQMDLTYLDENGDPVVGPTNRLQIATTLAENFPTPPNGQAAYPLREFGLFGAFAGDEYMINCIRHPVIHKDTASTLVRTIRLTF
jgi:hypothetical protein